MLRKELPKYMDPLKEKDIYDKWVKKGVFSYKHEVKAVADKHSNIQKNFSIVMPPPNVTGILHLGHAWDHTLQDVLTRYYKMKGHKSLWVPGTDHAGIATQMMVEKQLMKEGKTSKHDLGRDKFIARVWDWKENFGGNIVSQMKFLGNSCDWDQFRFTLDDVCSRAVRKSFVDLYKRGLIYRAQKLINWSPKLESALSDLEVEHRDVKGKIWTLAYPLTEGDTALHVATTRPETFLGDTAVAVHPEDERYKQLIGKKVKLPLVGREIPIIADSYVDPEFGTGVVKITPAHDFNDYEVGLRHKLEKINLLNPNGVLNKNAAPYEGFSVQAARSKILEDLKSEGFLIEEKPHSHAVGFCQRSGCVVEPYLSYQWFVKMDSLGQKATKATESGDVQFIPESSKKVFLHWMSILEDWCISRQLWWGHQIPAWKCQKCEKYTVSEETPSFCELCNHLELEQENDVLDTWFSSGLWPFEVMGWPEPTKLYKEFYPTSLLITGSDILFFWVARMIMMGLEFTGQVPFRKIYLHGMIRDAQGKKMSKTAGNAIDPLEVIKEHGADTLRFTFLSQTHPGKDIKLSQQRILGYRNFINKIWNASKFVSQSIDKKLMLSSLDDLDVKSLKPVDTWILIKLRRVLAQIEKSMEQLDFSTAVETIYHFVWHEYCDWYIESSKKDLYIENSKSFQSLERKKVVQNVLYYTLKHIVVTLHPFIPFVTESIYDALFSKVDEDLILNEPLQFTLNSSFFTLLEDSTCDEVDAAFEVIRSIRSIRSENQIKPSQGVKAYVDIKKGDKLELYKDLITQMAVLDLLSFEPPKSLSKTAVTRVEIGSNLFQVYVLLEGLVDFEKELERLNKNLQKEMKLQESLKKRLESENFVRNAPEDVVQEHQKQLSSCLEKINSLKSSIERFSVQ